MLAALGACTAMTVQWSAQKHGLALERVDVRLTQSRTATGHLFRLSVLIGGALSEQDRAKLQHAAENCPVARTLTGENALETRVSLDSSARGDAHR
jgi:putative redox protein